ncbi:glycerol-3-phosphate dehydrogenase, FAD-dependent [Oleiphilus messinensis]|uniref:Glycerol-3-phosphate dehydrogenase n=1 Tax=Oleiphilus messinensis TaxID=141451 RepID=A0A1Y0I504_9GAMM|nr:glycerol-3-phosphate dehydrogenase [Oleiphilus messinensis]ARU55289.1 glycerol-3-phosphate dehydrogenase, FAD-dependent [Oleiphilus messinensis]
MSDRNQNPLDTSPSEVDVFVVGGGINGVGIATDVAGRGLSVTLCEQNDLASATSSASSKLIHGGLRYLEHYEFRLVKEALAEREILLKQAPHLVQPLRFTLPHEPHLRPFWMIRTGLFLYDHLSKRITLPGTKSVRFDGSSPLTGEIRKGLQYSDCWVDDARLVITNALQAQRHGATIMTRTKCIAAKRIESEKRWSITLQDVHTGQERTIKARALVNAAGPWVTQFIKEGLQARPVRNIRLIKGSHIIVPRFHDYEGAFILQNTDNRIVFVLPYQDDFNLIGTTDKEYVGNPSEVAIDQEEINYLTSVVNSHFKHQIKSTDIVATYSGVRPLCDDESNDPSAVTRDYTMELETAQDDMPLLSIFGGKLTTYRKLAVAATERLRPFFPDMGPNWTHNTPLPGASTGTRTVSDITNTIREVHPWLPEIMLKRYSKSYGLLSLKFLKNACKPEDLGELFGATLYQREVDYLIDEEWALSVEDIVQRRSKLFLQLNDAELQRLSEYLNQRLARQQPEAQHQKPEQKAETERKSTAENTESLSA